ncbi:hypothetical protein [Clostridium gasigenes]|uniref:hypothetical protein n=1 Tax=Clostridium gasigenes TaxID=94869 RepID=UPI0014383A9B|nr:hypothetical protein [Clostridium gasigenes]MBU3106156.1 hypothetical protein [Clostridium gasigenes]NKF08823.1 hypothetical protein [Clostridium gasigenes]QSW21539.1 hypothetical protein J1C67_19305 [Clostridium gasigenes]
MARIKKDYMMSANNIEYIEEFKKENNLKYSSESLDLIIREHRKNSDTSTEAVIKIIGDRISENLKSELLGIKRASNASDKNSQIILEMLNGLFIKSGFTLLATTEIEKAVALDNATKLVEKRIESKRVSKLDKKF